MSSRQSIIAGIGLFVALLFYLPWLWKPERQVRLHQEHYLAAVANRNWSRAAGFLSPQYSDRWGYNKERAISAAREVFRNFFTLEIRSRDPHYAVRTGSATVTTMLETTGTGTPIADIVQRRLADLTRPFTFEWTHASGWPWDWQLMRVDQPQLEVPSGDSFD